MIRFALEMFVQVGIERIFIVTESFAELTLPWHYAVADFVKLNECLAGGR